ncbi:MAG: asparagine--tRNA ligase [Spirochaetota bacterium]|nr:MAG: asparagine--tRNA ligase [Spirochaetota bacterium]
MQDKQFSISEISQWIDREVSISGWVRHIRLSGSICFIDIRDGTGSVQAVVVENQVSKNTFVNCSRIKIETSLTVTGIVHTEPRAPGGFEIVVSDIVIAHIPEDEYPISKKSHGVDFLIEHRHLWIRSSRQLAILKVRSTLIQLLRSYFHDRGFVLIDTPILTGAIGESTGNLFETQYFDLGTAYLAQTGQLYLEAASSAFKNVFCFGPTFRAEKSKTRRHLTEFWMLEAEMAFCDSNCNMDVQEDMVCWVIEKITEVCKKELLFLGRELEPLKIVKPPFKRVTYEEAIEILRKEGFEIEWGDDIGGDEETVISERFEKPVFIYNYPKKVKAFYMKPNQDDSRTVLCDDLFAPEGYGEIIGGSQRNDDLDSLLRRIEDEGLDRLSYEWYLDIRRYGSVPHSGFGLGLERLLAWICKIKHVREAIPFPRLINRIYP